MLTTKTNSSIGFRLGARVIQAAIIVLALSALLPAQEALTLRQAVDLALDSNPLIAAAKAGESEANARIQQARSGYLPHAQVSESFQRSNNPVFVFTSLLTQRQFNDRNFSIDALNHPDALNNYQSRLSVEQVLFDARRTSHSVRAANFTRQLASEDTRRNQSDVILLVLQTYFGVVLAERSLDVARESVASAKADISRAESIYESGRSTLSDVLALRVHLAAVSEQQIRASNDVAVARAALNDALGVSLDRAFELTTPLDARADGPEYPLEAYRHIAAETRAEIRQAELTRQLTHTEKQIAGSAYLPRVVLEGTVEADRQKFSSKGGAYWYTAVTLSWNLWNGGETKARVEEARFAEARVEALQKRSDSAVHLEVRKAYFDLQSAAQRVEVASAASAEAEEGNRIIQNRQQAGLTTITELLRSETALTAARTRYFAAVYDYRVAAASLEHATGTLSADSASVN